MYRSSCVCTEDMNCEKRIIKREGKKVYLSASLPGVWKVFPQRHCGQEVPLRTDSIGLHLYLCKGELCYTLCPV